MQTRLIRIFICILLFGALSSGVAAKDSPGMESLSPKGETTPTEPTLHQDTLSIQSDTTQGVSSLKDKEPLAHICFSAHTGITYGNSYELVYSGSKTLSELIWPEHISPYIALESSIELPNFIQALRLQTAIPHRSGYMEDRDFFAELSNNPSHYSKHDAYLRHNFSLEDRITVLGQISERWQLGPTLGVTYQHKSWDAVDGYLQYAGNGAEWSEDLPKTPVHGVGISYSQRIWHITLGTTTIFRINETDSLTAAFHWRAFTHVRSVDSHFLRSLEFVDTMKGSSGIELSLKGVWYPFEHRKELGIAIQGGFQTFRTVGDTKIQDIGVVSDTPTAMLSDSAGARTISGSFSIGFIY